MTTLVSYGKTEEAWTLFEKFLCNIIDANDVKTVCEVGGGANPLFGLEYLSEKGIDYSVLDISEVELSKAPDGYKKIAADIASPDFVTNKKFDMVFSKMLLEHIKDADQFHKNVRQILNDKGLSIHFFPTLYAPPFIVNRFIPEVLAGKLLRWIAPRDEYQKAKFPAYYRLCRGPTNNAIQKLSNLGYEVMEYRGFFGHAGYYKKLKPIKMLHKLITSYLLRHPIPLLTSFAWLVLKKR